MRIPHFFLPVTLMFSFLACQNTSFEESASYPAFDTSLWPYLESFEIAAEQRGKDYDLNALDLAGMVDDIEDEGVAGLCHFGNSITNTITIDDDFWATASATFKEYVVFHELGHCVLFRDHDESTDQNGVCQSIMQSGTSGCLVQYNSQSREDYLDELFFDVTSTTP